jgi:hypothetical protein
MHHLLVKRAVTLLTALLVAAVVIFALLPQP